MGRREKKLHGDSSDGRKKHKRKRRIEKVEDVVDVEEQLSLRIVANPHSPAKVG